MKIVKGTDKPSDDHHYIRVYTHEGEDIDIELTTEELNAEGLNMSLLPYQGPLGNIKEMRIITLKDVVLDLAEGVKIVPYENETNED